MDNWGSGGTISGALGSGFGGGTFVLGANRANTILNRAGSLNQVQRNSLNMNKGFNFMSGSNSLDNASGIFSAKSQSGQALRAMESSGIAKWGKRLPLIGHGFAATSIALDVARSAPGQGAYTFRESTTSVAGGYAAGLGTQGKRVLINQLSTQP